ncbi:MAG: hydrogenase maturation protease [Candidatus Neomarinimicrobiota bacterium]|nr:MAG: hydrogenase maturation protease [Candidatus Neomarinimicrobiota bacterium]
MMKITVLGLGNLLYGDEGFGCTVARRLQETTDYPDDVEIVDGGTQGLYLLDYIEAADGLILVDAVIPLEAGFRIHRYDNDIPALIQKKMSSHQTGLTELLALARLHNRYPRELVLIGIPPKNLDMGIGLSPEVEALVPDVLAMIRDQIQAWLTP